MTEREIQSEANRSGDGSSHLFVTMDATSGIAAICVMLFHFTHKSIHVFPSGPIAVISFSYGRRLAHSMSVNEFSLRRIIRFYPMYILWTGLGLLSMLVFCCN
jgi:hypothetical protein